MPQQLIKGRAVVDDRWALLRDVTSEPIPPGPVIVSLPVWKSRRDELSARGDVGVWLAAADDPAALAADTATLPLIAVDFPQFTDGRGYSIGRLLRERYGFTGELRAIGDVQRDQLYYLAQCGFNAFAIRADRGVDDALAGLAAFSDGYQLTNARTPWFRRRAEARANTTDPPGE
ncbi:MAG TPA: DUF934 domain-containing protein [Casimicrobiaceae bacterium]|jgi:uncharacterized protein (DUF934 family)